jgi:phosphoribosyl-dephospho-CoA transferase
VDLRTHTLLRIGGPRALRGDLPTWVNESLERAPWVVVRRAQVCDELIPVGVRGGLREQRFASWIATGAVLEVVTPRALAERRAWEDIDPVRRTAIPALDVLDRVQSIMGAHGLDGMWGPSGSVGFELTSAAAVATVSSDLDLVVEVERPETLAGISLVAALATLPVRIDVLLETPHGAVALSEYVRARGERGDFMLRTTDGPRLTRTLGHTLGLADYDPRRCPHP